MWFNENLLNQMSKTTVKIAKEIIHNKNRGYNEKAMVFSIQFNSSH